MMIMVYSIRFGWLIGFDSIHYRYGLLIPVLNLVVTTC